MIIHRLEIENIKCLKAVSFKPKGNTVIIAGKNGHGKSSTMDAISYAFGGPRLCPKEPLREGQDEGFVRVDVGDYIVTRTFTRKGEETVSKLKLTTKGGFKPTSPQALLDGFFNKVSFDPLEFSRKSAKEQLETLKDVVGLDFRALDRQRAEAYGSRADTNSDLKKVEAKLEDGPQLDLSTTPDVEVSVTELMAELEKAQATQTEANKLLDALSGVKADIKDVEAKVKELKKRREKLLADEQDVIGKIENHEPIDPAPIKKQIAEADDKNKLCRAARKQWELEKERDQLKAQSKVKTIEMAEIDRQKREEVEAAKMPVEGLSFDDDCVRYKGKPFEQIGRANQIRVSVAIALALHSELNVMLIRDGNVLDEDSMEMVAQMAKEAEAQFIIEWVGEHAEAQVYIEDGQVRGGE